MGGRYLTPSLALTAVLVCIAAAQDAWTQSGHDAQRSRRTTAVGPANCSFVTAHALRPTSAIVSSAAIDTQGVAYIASRDGLLFAFQESCESPAWVSANYGSMAASVAVDDGAGVVFMANDLSEVSAVRAGDGTTLWTVTLPVYSSVSSGLLLLTDEHLLIAAADNKCMYALDPGTGAVQWTFTAGGFRSTPAFSNGTLFVGSYDGTLYAVDAHTGAQLWSNALYGGAVVSTPTVSPDGSFLVVSVSDCLVALQILPAPPLGSRAVELWRATGGALIVASPAMDVHGSSYVGTTAGDILAVDATGHALWSVELSSPAPFNSSAALDGNGTLYMADTAGRVAAVRSVDGGVVWVYEGDAPFVSSPAIAPSGVLYVGDLGGSLLAFSPTPGTCGSAYNPKADEPERFLTAIIIGGLAGAGLVSCMFCGPVRRLVCGQCCGGKRALRLAAVDEEEAGRETAYEYFES